MSRIFRNGTNYYKDHIFYTCADNDGSIFSLSDREEHRARRKALGPRFSKQAAEADAPGILRQLRQMENFMVKQSELEKTFNISDLFRVLAVSLTTQSHCSVYLPCGEDQCSRQNAAGELWGFS
jgi:cytochrome P450